MPPSHGCCGVAVSIPESIIEATAVYSADHACRAWEVHSEPSAVLNVSSSASPAEAFAVQRLYSQSRANVPLR